MTESNPKIIIPGEKQGQSVLLLETNKDLASRISSRLIEEGFVVDSLCDQHRALSLAQDKQFDFIFCEHLPGVLNGLEFLSQLKTLAGESVFILLTNNSNFETALEALRLGAADVILKPQNEDEIFLAIKKARERERLRSENEVLKSQIAKHYSFSNIIARSQVMLDIFETVKKIADYKTTVLLYGESGTGKELIARALHYNSVRRHHRFVALNCGAIPENLLESELFGHKRGAFTDAVRDKKGLFEEADGGSILLDEIGELPLHLQVKILRVLQENEICPVGDAKVIPLNVRVIAATLRDLENDALEGRFREDLYYRLNVITLRIPPLRERKEDIALLVNYFIKRNQERLGLPVFGIAKDAMLALMEHDWPGNIRELENSVERAMILSDGDEITLASLPKNIRGGAASSSAGMILPDSELSIKVMSRRLEESLIRRALEKTGGNRTHAAKILEISHRTLLYKLKEFGLGGDEEA